MSTGEHALPRDRAVDVALARALRPGQQLLIGQSWGAPQTLIDALPRHLERLRGSRLLVGMLIGDLPALPGVEIETFFPSGPLGSLAGLRRHGATYLRRSLYEIAAAIADGTLAIDVVLAMGTNALEAGGHSLGPTVDVVRPAADRGALVVLETGPGVPATGPGSLVDGEHVIAVDVDARPVRLSPTPNDRDRAIAANVAPLIPDGATIQLGMAPWVGPLAEQLRDRRGLRVHSGLLSDWAIVLQRAGALDAGAPIVATGAAGSDELYAWLADAPVSLRGADRTHAPATLAALPTFRAVSSVLEVDLRGDVNCEFGRGGRRGGVAGLRDFATAAARDPDGLSIVALAATHRDASRIVPALPAAASLPSGSVDVVVTEHGVADLRGLDARGRAEAMASIAAPEHREALRRAPAEPAAPRDAPLSPTKEPR